MLEQRSKIFYLHIILLAITSVLFLKIQTNKKDSSVREIRLIYI